ncbi:hypothetical protein EXIGLDRAFT_772025 [Exidia glandulosa HHB12029]|uniref:Uncharacterized protein n=1 Tax=Exidia glandulosa HHB12029 TaxID=1314781 RepID=A0A165FKR5_EXIGL|nr:hypothetical protein EXIGLDRAFT_772025 [Exidia glandulosa HHB12029]
MSSSSSPVITFYGIASKPGVGPWAPNAWKTRLCPPYKRPPYKTTFPAYPAHDGAVRSSTLKIAYDLDAQYPRLIPPGTRALQLIFIR